ncbi:cytochrome c oxidase family protein-like protein [Atractiella rhizophila]|nr:cytochrome c oxidase family protein-like protein [Atractiella rhizophila]
MPIAPITGKLKKRLIFDLSFSIGSGVVAAYAYWYGYHIPAVRKREAFYAKLEQERLAAV